MKYYVIKRDGRKVNFDLTKIINAISRSAKDDNVEVDVCQIASAVESRIRNYCRTNSRFDRRYSS